MLSMQNPFANIAEKVCYQKMTEAMDMIRAGYDLNMVDVEGNTALHWATWYNMDNLTKMLIEAGCDVRIGNKKQEVAAHWAAKCSNTYVLNLLKDDIAQLSVRDADGFTPMIISAQNDNIGMLEWLYLHGVSVEEQDNLGRTALHWACYKGRKRATQWLLSRAASVAHRDHDGTTAIHWACFKGFNLVSEWLIDVGSVLLLRVKDANGDSPISLAWQKKNHTLVLCLYKALICYKIFGRPYLSHNYFANVFLVLMLWTAGVTGAIMMPVLWGNSVGYTLVIVWTSLWTSTLLLWCFTCFSEPGWVSPKTILPQYDRIGPRPSEQFDALQPIESQMVHASQRWSRQQYPDIFGRLHNLESDLQKFNFQRHILLEARCNLVDSRETFPRRQEKMREHFPEFERTASYEAQLRQLETADQILQQRIVLAGNATANCRTEALESQGLGAYVQYVRNGEFGKICVTCRCIREMRSHHCKVCGRCVSRLDHHCPWIDNCVGINNQRSFVLFVTVLFLTIVAWYVLAGTYVWDSLDASWSGFVHLFPPHKSAGELLLNLCLLMTAAMNLVWFGFSLALLMRSVAYMMVNITAYEVITTPPHIKRRFPKFDSRLWFFYDCDAVNFVRRCFSFWTKSTEYDQDDFSARIPNEMTQSFIVNSKGKNAPDDGYGQNHRYMAVHTNVK